MRRVFQVSVQRNPQILRKRVGLGFAITTLSLCAQPDACLCDPTAPTSTKATEPPATKVGINYSSRLRFLGFIPRTIKAVPGCAIGAPRPPPGGYVWRADQVFHLAVHIGFFYEKNPSL